MADEKKIRDNVNRVKGPSPVATALFVGLRALDPLLQYAILGQGLGATVISKLGLRPISQGLPTRTGTFIDTLGSRRAPVEDGLSSYRLVLLTMAVGSSIKQIYWQLAIANEQMDPVSAVMISIFNTAFNSLNTLMFTCALTSAVAGTGSQRSVAEGPSSFSLFPPTTLVLGSALYVVGILTETISEIQRKNFKAKPENKGKNYSGGLFSFARHINYGGYTLWRTGFALAASGYIWASIVGGFFFYDFAARGIPVLDKYCQERYGQQWTAFKAKVPYKLLPYVY